MSGPSMVRGSVHDHHWLHFFLYLAIREPSLGLSAGDQHDNSSAETHARSFVPRSVSE